MIRGTCPLTVRDPEAARTMCIELGDFLRHTLRRSAVSRVRLDEELGMLRRYLAIETLRFGDRLHVVQDIATSCGEGMLLPMLLQPLVENALKHGISQLVEGGTLEIRARCSDSGLRLSVANPVDDEACPRPGAGVGLENLRRRLEAAYGGDAWLKIRREEGHFEVELFIPQSDVGATLRARAKISARNSRVTVPQIWLGRLSPSRRCGAVGMRKRVVILARALKGDG